MSPNLLAREAALAWGLALEVECELKRQYGLAGLRLSVSARHWLCRGEFPVPVSIGRAEPPDRHRHRAVIKGRKGQHLKLQLRSLRLLGVLSHGAGRDPQVGTGIADSPDDHPTLHPIHARRDQNCAFGNSCRGPTTER